ncbi:hypothetical protein KAR91_54600 [Candidatus Pacearchaeota archaeon]|nr:hypothetical protein [Candidatus Pacearchaeota archaeon]
MSKTHYRKVFKSDHLGIADLEDMIEANSNLVFTIKCVKQEIGVRVAGKKGNHNIAYFHENIKPLVLNATNSKVVSALANSKFIEDWANVAIQLYIDPTVKMKGEIVGGVRINPNPPAQKIELLPENQKLWSNAVQAFKRDGNLDKVLARVNISPENQQRIANEAQQ